MPEFDNTSPLSEPCYRLQLRTCNWTEWRPILVPVREGYILSLQTSGDLNEQQRLDFYSQFKIG